MLPERLIPSSLRARVRGASAIVLGAALLAGCGPASTEPSVEPLPEASAVVVAPDAVVPESDGGSAPRPSDEPAEDEPATDEPSEPAADACATLQAAWTTTNQALVNLSVEHPRAFANSFRVAAESMAEVDPPEAIADDWAAMAAYLARVNKALEDVDVNDADAVGVAFNGAVSAEDTEEAAAVASRITVFQSADCTAG